LLSILRDYSSRSRRLHDFSTSPGAISTSLRRASHATFIFAPFSYVVETVVRGE
jgi:hypothetical protein